MTPIPSYKSKIASRYIPVDAEQIGLKIAESDGYFASIKHDGHLAFLQITDGKAKLFDRSGNDLRIPSIEKAAADIKENVILAGELCVFENNASTSHREVAANLNHPDKVDFRFGAFDILEYKNAEPPADLSEKLNLIQTLVKGNDQVFTIEQHSFSSRKEIITFFKEATSNNREGIVVRVPSGITYKVKNVISLDCVVLGYAESTGDRAGWMRELLIGFALENNQFQIIGKCSNGFSETERQEWPKKLEQSIVASEYTEVSGAKTAFVFVRPEIVVEVSCLELINENSSGAIQKAYLTYDAKSGFTYQGQANTISLISPSFVRIREAKKVREKDAGASQAYDLVAPVEQSEATEANVDSEIVSREVYTKSGKGGTAVRKFVGLKTNKQESGIFSPFVLVYSDYSAGRKTPLEQEIFLCQNEKELESKMTELKEENIKKGWELSK